MRTNAYDDTRHSGQAAEVVELFRLCIVQKLLEQIESLGGVGLVDEALDVCRERLKFANFQIREARQLADTRAARHVAGLVGMDSETVEQVFLPSKAEVLIDELKFFLATARKEAKR